MTYVTSDIHGCYKQYRLMLEKIEFSDKDTMYVLGDVVDRGPEPIKILQDMSLRTNIVPIMGNHDHVAWDIFSQLPWDISPETIK